MFKSREGASNQTSALLFTILLNLKQKYSVLFFLNKRFILDKKNVT